MRINAATLGTPNVRSEVVKVPEWDNAEIEVCEMTGEQRADFEALLTEHELFNKDGKVNMPKYRRYHDSFFVACCMPEKDKGELSHFDLAKLLRQWSVKGLERVFAVADKLNLVSPASFDDAEKNSEGDRLTSGATPSPGNSEKRKDSSSAKSPAQS